MVAVNYGGRQEILRATAACMREAILIAEETGEVLEPTEEMFERGLYTCGMPDPHEPHDLVFGPLPVLGGEGVDGQVPHTQIGCAANGLAR